MLLITLLTRQEERQAREALELAKARENLEQSLAAEGGDKSPPKPVLSWGTEIEACLPVDRKHVYPGEKWVTHACNMAWCKGTDCLFVWHPTCRESKLVDVRKVVGIPSRRDGNVVERNKGECGKHTYADLVEMKVEENKTYHYDVRKTQKLSEDELKNIPKYCWGCGELL